MKLRILILRVLAAASVLTGFSSCSLLHNQNDWAYSKGSSSRYVPRAIGHPDAGDPVRGGN